MKLANQADATTGVPLRDALIVGSERVCLRTQKTRFDCVGNPPDVIADTERLWIRSYDYLYRRDSKGRWYASDAATAETFGAKTEDANAELAWLRGASEVALGEWSRCYLRDGLVYCWGHNTSGQLGYRSPDPDCSFMRHSVPCSSTPRAVPQLSDVVQIGGEDFRCARLTKGQVKCWGSIHEGRTTDGPRMTLCHAGRPCEPPPPTTIVGMPPIQQMAIDEVGLGVDADGNVWQWGHRRAEEDRFAAERLSAFSHVASVRTAGNATGCALYENGTVACFRPEVLRHHFAAKQAAPVIELVPVTNLSEVIDIATAKGIACGQRRDNSVWCWGAAAMTLCGQKGQQPETPCRVLPRNAKEQ